MNESLVFAERLPFCSGASVSIQDKPPTRNSVTGVIWQTF